MDKQATRERALFRETRRQISSSSDSIGLGKQASNPGFQKPCILCYFLYIVNVQPIITATGVDTFN